MSPRECRTSRRAALLAAGVLGATWLHRRGDRGPGHRVQSANTAFVSDPRDLPALWNEVQNDAVAAAHVGSAALDVLPAFWNELRNDAARAVQVGCAMLTGVPAFWNEMRNGVQKDLSAATQVSSSALSDLSAHWHEMQNDMAAAAQVGSAALSDLPAHWHEIQNDMLAAAQGSLRSLRAHWLDSMQLDVVAAMQADFPGARVGSDVANRVLKAMRPFGVQRHNVVYGHSISSDEINTDRGHLPMLLTRYYGTSFFLGGIGGAPYVGKTGFGAFAAHVPDDGHVVLVFGPHVGVSPAGEVGKFLRTGQGVSSTSCGAAITAYTQVTSGAKIPFDAQDLQLSWLREKLRPHCQEIAESGNQMVELAKKNYKVVEDEVLKIVNTDFGEGNLVLIGGIQINMPYPLPGYWMPMHFSIRSSQRPAVNLMPAFS